MGTAAAEGIPAIFCNCDVCKRARSLGGKRIRTRAQLLIDGELSVDYPPDAYFHALKRGIDFSAIKYLLVTHSHLDHFYGKDFCLRGGVFAHGMTSPTLDIYLNREAMEIFAEGTRREMNDSVRAGISLHEISKFQTLSFGGYTVHTLMANHSSEGPLLFSVEKGGKRLLHLCDTGALPEESYSFLEGLKKPYDLINLDCTYGMGDTTLEARHMGLPENLRTLERLEKAGIADAHTKRVITHFSHNSMPTEKKLAWAEREYGVIAAYDGMEIEL